MILACVKNKKPGEQLRTPEPGCGACQTPDSVVPVVGCGYLVG